MNCHDIQEEMGPIVLVNPVLFELLDLELESQVVVGRARTTIGWTILTKNLRNVHLVDRRERERMQFVFREKGASERARAPNYLLLLSSPIPPLSSREIRTS